MICASEESGEEIFFCGQRVDREGKKATVRYIGPVHVTGEEGNVWIGVEWDDATRGRHNGTMDGIHYFTCLVTSPPKTRLERRTELFGQDFALSVEESTPSTTILAAVDKDVHMPSTSSSCSVASSSGSSNAFCEVRNASFVRPEKLFTGITFLQALRERYIHDEESFDESTMVVSTTRDRTKAIELVGREKIAKKQEKLSELREVYLRDADVSSFNSAEEIFETCPMIEMLYLPDCLIASLQSLESLVHGLPHLRLLELSQNRLSRVESSLPFSFSCLDTLVLNQTMLDWSDVQNLEPSLPLLRELHLVCNGISHIQEGLTFQNHNNNDNIMSLFFFGMIVYIIFVVNFFALFIHSVLILFFHCASLVLLVSGFVHLEILDLENNDLSEFSSFSSLGKLPSLRQLNLNANHIRLLHFSESFSKGEFVHLSCILLADNCIDEWSTVDDLAHISSLVETRLQRNILFVKSSPSLARGLIIARLPRLTELNGAEVREKERIDAEKMYLKKFCIPDLSNLSHEEHAKLHPMYEYLANKHADYVSELLEIQTRSGETLSTSNSFVRISIRSMSASSADKPPKERRVPLSMSVQQLKLLCHGLFKLDPALQRLFVHADKSDPLPVELDDDFRDLNFFDVDDGAEILMHERDLDEEKQRLERLEADRQVQFREQEAAVRDRLAQKKRELD